MKRAVFVVLLLVLAAVPAWALDVKVEGALPGERLAITSEISGLFVKVQDLLFMDVSTAKIKVVVFRTDEQLKNKWKDLYGMACPYKAFYRFETNTVYLSRENLRSGIIAHELAHAVMANRFNGVPEDEKGKRERIARWVEEQILK